MSVIPRPPGSGASAPQAPEPKGMAGRIHKISKSPPPAPKGKGIAMALLGVAVLASLIHTFLSDGSAAEGVREAHEADIRRAPSAPSAPPESPPASSTPDPLPLPVGPSNGNTDAPTELPGELVMPGSSFTLPEGLPGPIETRLRETLSIFENLALALQHGRSPDFAKMPVLLAEVPAEQRDGVRMVMFELLLKTASTSAYARGTFETAAWLVPEATTEQKGLVSKLILVACQSGLGRNASAGAAMAFLEQVPDPLGSLETFSLEDVILDARRPLDIRLAAARLTEKRELATSKRLVALHEDPTTHPLLRAALASR